MTTVEALGLAGQNGHARRFLAPAIWLSGRLSFSRKYLLVGIVVLLALTALSVPLLDQNLNASRLAATEREGLRQFVTQAELLDGLVALRGQTVDGHPAHASAQLVANLALAAERARQAGLVESANRLEQSWKTVSGMEPSEDVQRRFGAWTAAINSVLALAKDSARTFRLNVDQHLDATFDMLTIRLPLVLDTLGKQRDALTLKTDQLSSYALAAQVALTESVPVLKGGIGQLVAGRPASSDLQPAQDRLLEGIQRQQDAADDVLADPSAITRLTDLASSNIVLAKRLLDESVTAADRVLEDRVRQYHRTVWIIASLLVGALSAIAYLFAGMYLSTIRSLKSLSMGTDAFCGGRLETRIRIDTRDELVLVARNFNTMADEVDHLLNVIREQNESRQRQLETLVEARTAELAEKNEQLRAAGERVREELDIARKLQLAILPHDFPDEGAWSLHACMFPALELGGDFYDCFPLPGGRYGVLVADVSGKGVGAAFFMAVSRTVFLDSTAEGRSPSAVLARSNDLLCERNPMELFVTALYGIYDPGDGRFNYANAGHPPPLLRRASGAVEALPGHCDIALGIAPAMQYTEEAIQLAPGETLLLYTDGVTEAFSRSGDAYGEDRLRAWFTRARPGQSTAAELVAGLVKDVEVFVDGAHASDDLTCLLLCRKQGGTPLETPAIELGQKKLLLEYHLPSRVEEIPTLAAAVEGALPERADLAFTANLCLDELITNIIQHGLKGEPDRFIHVRMNISDEWLEIILKDDAPPFDPFVEAPAPDLDLDVDDRPIGGLGVHLVKTMMDDVRAYYDGSGNLIVLLKTLKQYAAGSAPPVDHP